MNWRRVSQGVGGRQCDDEERESYWFRTQVESAGMMASGRFTWGEDTSRGQHWKEWQLASCGVAAECPARPRIKGRSQSFTLLTGAKIKRPRRTKSG